MPLNLPLSLALGVATGVGIMPVYRRSEPHRAPVVHRDPVTRVQELPPTFEREARGRAVGMAFEDGWDWNDIGEQSRALYLELARVEILDKALKDE